LALAGVGGFGLLICLICGETPAKWPFKPVSKRDDPETYEVYLTLYATAFVVGAILLAMVFLAKNGFALFR
jgi:hypothetical protein